jgi:hypothetical protein
MRDRQLHYLTNNDLLVEEALELCSKYGYELIEDIDLKISEVVESMPTTYDQPDWDYKRKRPILTNPKELIVKLKRDISINNILC